MVSVIVGFLVVFFSYREVRDRLKVFWRILDGLGLGRGLRLRVGDYVDGVDGGLGVDLFVIS